MGKTKTRRAAQGPISTQIDRFLAEQTSELLWYVDADGKVLHLAGAWQLLLGRPAEAFRESWKIWEQVVHPQDQARVVGIIENPAEHLEESGILFRAIHPDGLIVRLVRLRMQPHRDADGRLLGVACVGSEPGEMCHLAGQLPEVRGDAKSPGLLPLANADCRCALFDAGGDAIFILEPESLRVLNVNYQAQVMTGFDAATLRAMVFDEWLGNQDSADFRRHLAQQAQGGAATRWQGHAIGADKRVREVEILTSAITLGPQRVIQCSVSDVSEHWHTVRTLLRFEQILRGISDSTVIFNLAGQAVFANAAAERLWGHVAAAWEEIDVWDLYTSKVPVEMGEDGRIELEGGHDHAEGEFAIQRADGSERTCFTSFSLVRDQSQRPIGLAAISRDVTNEKALQQQILQVQKMDCIGTLAGGVAHDFNNLLGGILGYAQLIKTNTDAASRIYTQAEFVEQSAVRASQLTQQLLSFSRKGKYNLRVTNLNQVVRGALTLLEGSLPKSILLHTDLDPDPCPVEADITQIEQVMLNLCINARDAMSEAGWITIRTRTRDLDDEFCRDRFGLSPGRHAELLVKDTGHGIDAETMAHIFEPFYTTKELGKGTGLGLSVVYGIVKNHGGHIDVRSTPGVGSQFLIYLPATTQPVSLADDGSLLSADGGNERILVVDDEPTIRELVTDVLKTYGYRILRAKDGVEAIEIYRRNRANIALVLLDMQMPVLNGLVTYRRLREIDPGVRAILSSGYGMDQDIQEILNEGVLAFIQKPYKINELARVVRECLDRAVVR